MMENTSKIQGSANADLLSKSEQFERSWTCTHHAENKWEIANINPNILIISMKVTLCLLEDRDSVCIGKGNHDFFSLCEWHICVDFTIFDSAVLPAQTDYFSIKFTERTMEHNSSAWNWAKNWQKVLAGWLFLSEHTKNKARFTKVSANSFNVLDGFLDIKKCFS